MKLFVLCVQIKVHNHQNKLTTFFRDKKDDLVKFDLNTTGGLELG